MNINQDVESLQLKAFAKNGPKWGVSREVNNTAVRYSGTIPRGHF